MKKVLWFEGVGCVERGDVENCRIRTAFKIDDGEAIYLEITGVDTNKYTPAEFKCFKNYATVDHCFYFYRKGIKDICRITHDCERKVNFEYSKAGILKFVNETFGCSFDEIRVADVFYGYCVHNGCCGYNLMNEHGFDDDKANAARDAYNHIDMQIREQLGEKYSKIGLFAINDDSIVVKCYASVESMRRHGMDPDNRYIAVPIVA